MSRDNRSAVNVPPIVAEDQWHVALAPGEIKVVSLEQLDDLFRLSIVDAETKVWQDGMSDWQPLRVIAGLDEAPVAESKRTHPKPPSPRSAPPPPRRPQSVAPPSPSVRPATPPPRPQSVAPPPSPSVRPAPPPPRAHSVAPASVWAAPIALAATQPAFSAPIAVQPIASVRPLVVSARPPVEKGVGGFGRFLLGLSLVAGLGVSLYRNGVVRDAARSVHQDAMFAKLEGALGGPAFGTLRAVEQSSAASFGSNLNSDLNANLAADAPVTPPRQTAQIGVQLDTTSSAAHTPVVSLESLKQEKSGSPNPKVETPVAATLAPPSPKPVQQPSLRAAPSPKAGATKATIVQKAAPPSKPLSEMNERERLNAAIGQSMSTASSKNKSKASKASEYDPLNPKL